MKILVAFASKHGHTERVARTVARVIDDEGHEVDVVDVRDPPRGFSVEPYRAAVLTAPIRFGRHMGAMRRFAKKHRAFLDGVPSAFLSCSLAAAKPDDPEARREVERTVDDFIATTGWQPRQLGVFAGALLYRKYNLLSRLVLERISKTRGGDTDTSRDYDYTDWDGVEQFARDFLTLLPPDDRPRAPTPS